MNLSQIAQQLGLEDLTPELVGAEPVEVTLGYTSDLLSDVLARAPRGGLLVTVQAHINAVAVAVNTGLAAIVFVCGRKPDERVRKKAADEGVRLFLSSGNAFDVTGRLYELGLRGPQR